jgi:hypothetical protein
MGECFREKENQKQGQESKSQEEIAIREGKIQKVAPCGKGAPLEHSTKRPESKTVKIELVYCSA